MKKHYLILLSSIILSCLCITRSAAQALYPVSIDEKIQGSSLIVEGTVVSKHSFWNAAHTMIFTANKIKLHKIFKGNESAEHIEVMTQGGSVDNMSIEASELLDLSVNDIGMFFCLPNQIGLKDPSNNILLMDVYGSAQGFLSYDMASKTAGAPFARYANIVAELYPAVVQRTGRNYVDADPQFSVGTEPIPQNEVIGITSFSPTSVISGATSNVAQNLLTINGTDFGAPGLAAAVLFDDANNGTGSTPFTVAYDDPLMVSWTNTQIQVRVPARAGTGFFQVRDQAGAFTFSPAVLTVEYSVLTATNTALTFTSQSNLMNNNSSGGYSILYSVSTNGSGLDFDASPIKATFQRALNTWKETSGLNFIEAGSTTTQVVAGDGNNVVMFDNANTGLPQIAVGVLAVCYSYNSFCSPIGSFPARKTGFDIVVRNSGYSLGTTAFENGPCYPSAAGTTVDMETVLLHELGHALNLGHINDDYQFVSGGFGNRNPGKLMNYSIISGAARKSLDWAAYVGSTYTINPRGLTYGTCTAVNTEMIPLAAITEPKDDCPLTFPATTTPNNTLLNFDLVHATSNKFVDPQFTNINCSGLGTPVTNNAYYAIRTGVSGTLDLAVGSFSYLPTALSGCGTSSVRLTLYEASSCPTAQAFPAPVACRSFNSNGPITPISGLTANTTYLIYVDGAFNTKASFSLLLNGSALPVRVSNFNGQVKANYNEVFWTVDIASTVRTLILEGSEDGQNFTTLQSYNYTSAVDRIQNSYNDFDTREIKHYRIKMINADGSLEYSNTLLLRRNLKQNTAIVSPNPANDHVNILLNRSTGGKIEIQLLDAGGKILKTQVFNTASGNQSLLIDKIGHLAKGTYLVRINDGTTISHHKLLKL